MRNWSFLHCVREANYWANCRGNGEFTLSEMSVRTEWTHFLSGSPRRLANSSAKILFQGFRLLFTFPVGKCGPRKEIRLQEWGKGSGSEYRVPQRKAACAKVCDAGSARWLAPVRVVPGQAHQRDSCQWLPFYLMGFLWLFHLFYENLKYDIWFHLCEILRKAKLI